MSALISIAVIIALLIVGGCASSRIEKNAPPIGRLIEVDGESIHLVDLGPVDSNEPPIVLIHGASVNLRDMKLALGDELAKSRRVIIVDRPGRGYSTRPKDGWRMDRQASLIRSAVRAVDADRPIIVGQSLGGAVALNYALQFQDEISGLVLLAPVSHKWPGGVAWYNKVSGWPLAGILMRRILIPIYAPLAAKSGVRKSFAPDEAPDGYFEKSGLSLLFRPNDFRNNAADLRHLKAQIVAMEDQYDRIRVPTAILAGVYDTTVSPTLHSSALAREIPDAFFELLPDTGHALHHAETAKILDAIDLVTKRARELEMRRNAAE